MKKLFIVYIAFGIFINAHDILAIRPKVTITHLPYEIQEMITGKIANIRPSEAMLDKAINALQTKSDEEAAQEMLNFGNEMGNVLQGIKSLGMVNKRFYKIINNPKNTDYYIRTIARNWGQDVLPIAIALGTPGAKKWIEEYIKTPEGLKAAKQLLFTAATYGGGLQELGEKAIFTLKQVGFNINTPDENGKTALFYAVETGNVEMVTYLLQHGANKNHRDNAGNKAVNYIPEGERSLELVRIGELLK